ncbi:MAG: rhamnan synthesis F family protein [Endomicrobiaceae bacterium]
MKNKRIFLFAAYDSQGIVDDSLLYYLHALSRLGDIAFFMDNDISKSDREKLSLVPNLLYFEAKRHGEYDFGSYKRLYQWLISKKIINKYDWVYLVNDSVYGPFSPLKPILEKMESSKADVVSMFKSAKKDQEFLQTWFLGLRKTIAMSDWFNKFINSVKKEETKGDVVKKYELGLNNLLVRYKVKTYSFMFDKKLHMTRNPLHFFRAGIPFLKKNSVLTPHSHIGEIKYILKALSKFDLRIITDNIRRLRGDMYIKHWIFGFAFIRYVCRKFLFGQKC